MNTSRSTIKKGLVRLALCLAVALALVWGDNMDEAKQRALLFLQQTTIEGQDSSGGNIITNLEYLRNHLDQLLTF